MRLGKNYRAGFSLIELMIVIGVLAVIAVIGVTNFYGTSVRKNLTNQAQKAEAVLREVQQKAAGQEEESAWGVKFFNTISGADYYETFYGGSYAAGTVREIHYLPVALSFSDPTSGNSTEVFFAQTTGTTDYATITIAVTGDENQSESVIIKNTGRVERE